MLFSLAVLGAEMPYSPPFRRVEEGVGGSRRAARVKGFVVVSSCCRAGGGREIAMEGVREGESVFVWTCAVPMFPCVWVYRSLRTVVCEV